MKAVIQAKIERIAEELTVIDGEFGEVVSMAIQNGARNMALWLMEEVHWTGSDLVPLVTTKAEYIYRKES